MTTRATDDGWIEFRKDKPKINPATFFEIFGPTLGLDQHYQFRLVKDKADVKQNRHQKFQLFYKNIRVEGAEYGLHTRDGGLQVAHGRIPDGLAIDVSKPIQENVALAAALADQKLTLDAFKGSEKLPKGELVLKPTASEMVAENLRLAYVFQIKLNQVYVDAISGQVIGRFSLVQFDDFGGSRKVQTNTLNHSLNRTANTLLAGTFTHSNNRYSGGQRVQSFETEQHDQGGVRLTMSTPNRATALETRSDLNSNGVIFNNNGRIADIRWGDDPVVTNAINDWGANNQSATTAHWIIWRAYEYFRGFGINNLGAGGQIARVLVNTNINDNAFFTLYPLDGLAYVYVGTSGTNLTQGFSIVDILGHEYGHGMSRVLVGGNGLTGDGGQFAEARALNEGFSDIFGIATERRLMPSEWNWTVGEDVNNPLFVRNSANPATSGGGDPRFVQPSTYQGTNWDNDPETSGHTNSGVLSHWFYLINHWGTPVSFDDALNIVVHALDNYMINASTYLDARNATVFAAKDLFGNCSPQERTAVEVWQHVGLGYPFQYACAAACDYQAELFGPSTASPGQFVQLTANCVPGQNNACSGVQFSLNGQTPTSNNTFSFNVPSGAGPYTYTVGLSKAGCYTKTATKTIQVEGGNPCNFSSGPRRVGTWNGLEVQIRQYPNGKRALVTAIIGSPTDKHYPRGDNFWDNFTKDPGVDGLRGCLNAGESGWYGLTFPSGISPNPGYVQGSESDGAVYFQLSGGPRVATFATTAEDVAIVKVRPNPVQDEVTIQFTLSKPQTVTMRIVDLQGRPLQKHSHEGAEGRNEKTLNVSSLTTGIYALEVVLENQRVIHKLLKQ